MHFWGMSNLVECLKSKNGILWLPVSIKVTPYHQDRWVVQAACPADASGTIYGAWDKWQKLIQNTPNFGIWTGTLNRGLLLWEDRCISLFMCSKLMRWEGYKDLGTPCALKWSSNRSTPLPRRVSFQNQVLTWRSLQRISETWDFFFFSPTIESQFFRKKTYRKTYRKPIKKNRSQSIGFQNVFDRFKNRGGRSWTYQKPSENLICWSRSLWY